MWSKAILVVATSTCLCLFFSTVSVSSHNNSAIHVWVLPLFYIRGNQGSEIEVTRPTSQPSGFGFWTQVCSIPSPVLLNKSLYIFNSLKFKMYKRQLSDCLVFWPLGFASLEKILPFLEFSFGVNSKHINYIGEYITFFHFPCILLCSAFFFTWQWILRSFHNQFIRHFLFFCSCSLQAIQHPEHQWTLGPLADSKGSSRLEILVVETGYRLKH